MRMPLPDCRPDCRPALLSAAATAGFVFLLLLLSPLGAWPQTPGPTPITDKSIAAKSIGEQLSYPPQSRLLIIHADDLGMNHSTNRAALEALERGWVTSASILVPCPWFPEVVRWARSHPHADLGIHLDLTSEWTSLRWRPIVGQAIEPSLTDDEGFLPLTEAIAAKQAKPEEAEIELRAQIELARQAGVRLSHFDTHMGTLFQTTELFHLYQKLGREYGLPILQAHGARTADQEPPAIADVAPGAVILDGVLSMEPGVKREDWLATYENMLARLKPGVYELIVHLGYDDEEMRGATFDHPDYGAAWRQADLDTMRSPEFQKFLQDQGFKLTTWSELARTLGHDYATGGPGHPAHKP